jgi:hypothetical protein
MKDTAKREDRTVYEVSSLMALSAIAQVPEDTLDYPHRRARRGKDRIGDVVRYGDHYRSTLADTRKGYVPYGGCASFALIVTAPRRSYTAAPGR